MSNQKGVAHLFLLIAGLGILAFLLVSSLVPFKDKLFSFLYPKPSSKAQEVSQEPYGINDWFWKDEAIVAVKDAGVTWMRLEGVVWKNIEPVQGSFNWNGRWDSKVDDQMAQAAKYGMKVTAPIWLAPEWAWQPGGLNLPRPEPLAEFIKVFLRRYPGQIAAVEILAEENTANWPFVKQRDAIFYAPVLKAAYQAVKEVSPNTLVVTSSLWGAPEGYLEDLYAMGVKGYFDVANFHYYPGNNSPTVNYTWLISHYRKVMEKYSDGEKPIWLTEFAWPINDEPMGLRARDMVSPQQQSDYLSYVLNTSMKSGFIQKVFWYVLTGNDGMAMIHDNDYYDWRKINQPKLAASIGPSDTTLTVSNSTTLQNGTSQIVDWAKGWPQNGILIVESEQIKYSSLSPSADGSSTIAQGLSRGANGTSATTHAAGTLAKNQDLTMGFKRQMYYTLKNFAQANPSWTASQVSPLPDVPPPAATGVSVANPGFENGTTGWGGVTVDTTQFHSGAASAKIVNTTGNALNVGQRLPLEPGKSYFLKAWVKVDPTGSGNMNAMVKANLNDSSGKFVALVPGNYYIYDTKGDWREVHFPFQTPANVTQVTLFMSTDKGTGTAWFDDISVEPYDLSVSILTPTPTPTPSDTTPPAVSITNPVNGGTVAHNSMVNITASASDNSGVAKVEFWVGGNLKCVDTVSPYDCSWKVPGKRGAKYTLKTTAHDSSANQSSTSIAILAQ